jgi:hypothetical protein
MAYLSQLEFCSPLQEVNRAGTDVRHKCDTVFVWRGSSILFTVRVINNTSEALFSFQVRFGNCTLLQRNNHHNSIDTSHDFFPEANQATVTFWAWDYRGGTVF